MIDATTFSLIFTHFGAFLMGYIVWWFLMARKGLERSGINKRKANFNNFKDIGGGK